jgi:hypothetical protein
MSGTYEPPTGTGRRPAPSDEEIDKMATDMLGGGGFSGAAMCSSLCRSLERDSDELQELQTAIGQRPPTEKERERITHLVALMHAINAQMMSLRCPTCFFT